MSASPTHQHTATSARGIAAAAAAASGIAQVVVATAHHAPDLLEGTGDVRTWVAAMAPGLVLLAAAAFVAPVHGRRGPRALPFALGAVVLGIGTAVVMELGMTAVSVGAALLELLSLNFLNGPVG